MERKLARLNALLQPLGTAAVALSGGVDSSVVARAAFDALGAGAVAVTGVSASLAGGERADARSVAAHIGIRLVELGTAELSDPRYVRNAPDRCYFCKAELYGRMRAWADRNGIDHLLDGLNADDDPGDRPGVRAGTERGVLSPLRDAALAKTDVRALARLWGLPTADKPAAPCLASRIPHGTAVTAARLEQVGRAEAAIRALGFPDLRVRHQGAVARVEVPREALTRLAGVRGEVTAAVRAAGFRSVELDPAGLRRGGADVVEVST